MIDSLIPQYGGPGLAAFAFLAATLIPLSSEAALLLAIHLGMSPHEAVLWASSGNGLACTLNYWIGYVGGSLTAGKLQSSRFGSLAWSLLHRRGWIALLLSWLPAIGDPITVLAGFVRIPLTIFLPIVIGLRILRYVVLASF